jgi:hypothetical protein
MAFSTAQSEKRGFRIASISNDLASLKMAVYPERMDARVKFCRMDSANKVGACILYRTSSLLKNFVFQQAAKSLHDIRLVQLMPGQALSPAASGVQSIPL